MQQITLLFMMKIEYLRTRIYIYILVYIYIYT